MKILFTGATGVVGRAALPHLSVAGHDVIAVYRSETDRAWLEGLGARPVAVDLFDPDAVGSVVSGVDTVAHFATSIPSQNDMRKRASWDTNDRLRSTATAYLADAALDHGVRRFIQESISFVYADGGEKWLDESAPIEPAWDVLDSALTAEEHVARFRSGGGAGVVLRMARLYGPGEVSGEFIEAVRNRAVPIIGTGANYVSSLHVDDAGTAVVAALTAPDGVFNVADDEPMRSADNLRALSEVLGAPPPRRIPSIMARIALGRAARLLTISQRVSNRAFREVTGWTPEHANARQGWGASVRQNRDERP
ncbi:MAG TPA: NAD-dependent epimerase/dehydratase family protein [Acidimicrobiia bacterium]